MSLPLAWQQVLIVGTGAFAQGLASLAIRSGATASYDVALGSRKMLPGRSGVLPGLEETPVRSLEEALPQADMVSAGRSCCSKTKQSTAEAGAAFAQQHCQPCHQAAWAALLACLSAVDSNCHREVPCAI